MRYLYILAVYLAAPLISLVMLWRGFRDHSYWSNFRERFGFGEQLPPGSVWITEVNGAVTNGPARTLKVQLQPAEVQILRR